MNRGKSVKGIYNFDIYLLSIKEAGHRKSQSSQ